MLRGQPNQFVWGTEEENEEEEEVVARWVRDREGGRGVEVAEHCEARCPLTFSIMYSFVSVTPVMGSSVSTGAKGRSDGHSNDAPAECSTNCASTAAHKALCGMPPNARIPPFLPPFSDVPAARPGVAPNERFDPLDSSTPRKLTPVYLLLLTSHGFPPPQPTSRGTRQCPSRPATPSPHGVC